MNRNVSVANRTTIKRRGDGDCTMLTRSGQSQRRGQGRNTIRFGVSNKPDLRLNRFMLHHETCRVIPDSTTPLSLDYHIHHVDIVPPPVPNVLRQHVATTTSYCTADSGRLNSRIRLSLWITSSAEILTTLASC